MSPFLVSICDQILESGSDSNKHSQWLHSLLSITYCSRSDITVYVGVDIHQPTLSIMTIHVAHFQIQNDAGDL